LILSQLLWNTGSSAFADDDSRISIFKQRYSQTCFRDLAAPSGVIASEAKQSIWPRNERVDCFVASLLAMTSYLRDLAARCARGFAKTVLPSEVQKAQGMPGAQCARSLACEIKSTRA